MKNAFTIIEVLVALFIINIIFFTANFATNPFKKTFDLNSSARELEDNLRITKNMAISKSCIAELEAKENSIVIRTENIKTKTFEEVKKVYLSKDLFFLKPVVFRFSSNGMPCVGFSGTASLCSKNGLTKKIIVSSFGRIRIE